MNVKLLKTEVSKGQRMSIDNARELYNGAKLLYDNKKYSLAISLIVMAHEEIGKVFLIGGLNDDNENKRKIIWQEFYNHEGKLEQIISNIISLAAMYENNISAKGISEIKIYFSKTFDKFYSDAINIAKKMNQYKKMGFYVDYTNGQFTSPSLSKNTKSIKKLLDGAIKHFDTVLSIGEVLKYIHDIEDIKDS